MVAVDEAVSRKKFDSYIMPEVIQTFDLTKTYPLEEPVHALRGVNLTIGPGEFVSIIVDSSPIEEAAPTLAETNLQPPLAHVCTDATALATARLPHTTANPQILCRERVIQ